MGKEKEEKINLELYSSRVLMHVVPPGAVSVVLLRSKRFHVIILFFWGNSG